MNGTKSYRSRVWQAGIAILVLSALPAGQMGALPRPEPQAGAAGKQASKDVVLKRSDVDGIDIQVTVPQYNLESISTPAGRFQQITLDGYHNQAQPGQPALPQQGVTVAIPPGAEATLRVAAEGVREINVGRLAPAATQHLPSLTNGAGPAQLRPGDIPGLQPETVADPQAYGRDAFSPDATAWLSGPESWRDHRLVRLTLAPIQYNPARGIARLAGTLQLHIDLAYPNGQPALQNLPLDSPEYEREFNRTFLNPDSARLWRVRDSVTTTTPCALAQTSNSWKVAVRQTGLYKLDYATLSAAGFPLAGVSMRTLHVSFQCQEIAISVHDDNGNNGFDPGDYILFYGQASPGKFSDTNIYWLTYGGADGLRMATVQDNPSNPNHPTDTITTVHLEQNRTYQQWAPTPGDSTYDDYDRWYYDYITSVISPTATYTLWANNVSTNENGNQLLIRLVGDSVSSSGTHIVRATVNGQMFTSASFYDSNVYTFTIPLTANQIINGANTVAVTSISPVVGTQELIDWLELDYRELLQAQNDQIVIRQDAAGSNEYVVNGFSTPDNDALDVTNPSRPRVILLASGRRASGQPTTSTVDFKTSTTSPATYLVQNASQRITPQFSDITLDTPSQWGLPGVRADWVAISYHDFIPALTPLVQLRQSQGLATAVLDVQDVYDEFNGGMVDPQAIHDFLAYAYQNWTANQGSHPQYALLVGDGHYDYKGYCNRYFPNNCNGSSGTEYIPPYLINIDPYVGETAADNRFVTITSGDVLPDMQIGRLPVNSLAEATTVVNKIHDYEATPPAGSWRSQMAFFADSAYAVNPNCAPDTAGNFWTLSDDTRSSSLQGQAARQDDGVYFDPCNRSTPQPATTFNHTTDSQRQAMINEVNSGRILVNYIGHSAIQYESNQNIFGVSDVPSLTNGKKLPVFLDMTCYLGYFISPNYPSLAESLLRAGNGGSVANFSPTGEEVYTGHEFLNDEFLTILTGPNPPSIGSIVDSSKGYLYTEAPGYRDLLDTFMLLGDPAMKIQIFNGGYSVFLPSFMGSSQ